MSTLREAAQQALEALEYHVEQTRPIWKTSKAIVALMAALEQPEQEPVAWMSRGKELLEFSRPDTVYGSHTIPLYPHPPRRDIEKAYESACKIINEQDKKLAELEAVNAELLESLRVAVDSDLGRLWVWPATARETWLTNARATIAKAEGQK